MRVWKLSPHTRHEMAPVSAARSSLTSHAASCEQNGHLNTCAGVGGGAGGGAGRWEALRGSRRRPRARSRGGSAPP